jgi:hypothetical protein
MTCVVPSAEGAVDVRVTSAEDSGAVVSSAVVSSGAEDVEDVAAAEVVSSVEDVMGWEMELVRLLEVVTVVKAALVGKEEEDMAAVVVSGSVSDGDRRRHTGRVGHDGKQASASTTGCGRVGFDSVARGAGFVKSRRRWWNAMGRAICRAVESGDKERYGQEEVLGSCGFDGGVVPVSVRW